MGSAAGTRATLCEEWVLLPGGPCRRCPPSPPYPSSAEGLAAVPASAGTRERWLPRVHRGHMLTT